MVVVKKIIDKQKYEKEHEKPNQEEIWNSISNPWKKYRMHKLPMIEKFLIGKKGKIVDLGCGTGRNMIPNNHVEYHGVDFSKGQLKHAKELVEEDNLNAKLYKSKIDNLPMFEDEMFDYGLFMATLHCLESKEERENAVKEFYRILKNGSEGLISVWNGEDNRFDGKKEVYIPWKKGEISHMRFYYIYEKEEIVELLESVGFKILEIYKPQEGNRFSRKNWIIRIGK